MGRAGFAPATKKGRFYRPLPHKLIGGPTQVKSGEGRTRTCNGITQTHLANERFYHSATSPDSPKEV